MESKYYKSYKKDFEHSYAFGATLVFYLLEKRPEDVIGVIVHPSFRESEGFARLKALCGSCNAELLESEKLTARLSPKENVFVVGVFRKYEQSISEGCHIVLDNPSNSGNVGTIMRTMLAFDYHDLAIIRPGLDIFDPKTVRSSMGAVFSLGVEYFDSFEQYRQRFASNSLYPFMLGGERFLDEMTIPNGAHSLIFGNEATGLADRYAELGTPVKIRSSDAVDSLNLSVAAAIGMDRFRFFR